MFWGIAAMTAAEYNFPNAPTGDTWLTLAEGVFYDQSSDNGQGWDTTICEGGLRWQKFIAQSGYVMKNAVSNGGFMMLAARLAMYTQKQSFADWAEKEWNWATTAGMIDNTTWTVFDSISKGTGGKVADCTGPDHTQWTYNYGTFMTGCAYMYAFVSLIVALVFIWQRCYLFYHANSQFSSDERPNLARQNKRANDISFPKVLHCEDKWYYL